LYFRIGIFEQSIGDMESILGEEVRQLTRTSDDKLTPEQEEKIDHAAR
jgi:hypothetical protein